MLTQYIKELISEWVGTALLTADLILFIVSSATQKFTFPSEFYWIVALLAFIIANFRVHSRAQQKLDEYESLEANINIRVLESKVIIKAPILAAKKRVKDSRSADGLDDAGLPIAHRLVAKVDIENAGMEPGTLIWELDLNESELPEFFTVYEDAVNGYFDDEERKVRIEVEGRDRYEGRWILPLLLKEDSPKLLAHHLSNPADYRLLLHYKTKRIGGETPKRTVVIEGDFTTYRDSLVKKWKTRQQVDLIEFANGAPIDPQIF